MKLNNINAGGDDDGGDDGDDDGGADGSPAQAVQSAAQSSIFYLTGPTPTQAELCPCNL